MKFRELQKTDLHGCNATSVRNCVISCLKSFAQFLQKQKKSRHFGGTKRAKNLLSLTKMFFIAAKQSACLIEIAPLFS